MTPCNFATAMCWSRNQLLAMAQVPPTSAGGNMFAKRQTNEVAA